MRLAFLFFNNIFWVSLNWSCVYCGKGNLSFEEATACEQNALDDFKYFPEIPARLMTPFIENCTVGYEALTEAFWSFFIKNYFLQETVLADVSGAKYTSVIVDLYPLSEEVEVEFLGYSQKAIVSIDSICRPRNGWSRRHLKQFIKIVTEPRESYTEPLKIRPEYHYLLERKNPENFEKDYQKLSDWVNDQLASKKQPPKPASSTENQKKLDSFFMPVVSIEFAKRPHSLALGDEVNSRSSPASFPAIVIPSTPSLQRPAASLGIFPNEHQNDALYVWNFIMTFGDNLKIYPFSFSEWECSLMDESGLNPIASAVFLKFLRLIVRERHDSGRMALVNILENSIFKELVASGTHFCTATYPQSSEPVDTPVLSENIRDAIKNGDVCYGPGRLSTSRLASKSSKTKIKWYGDKFDDSNWHCMLVGFLVDLATEENFAFYSEIMEHLINVAEDENPGSTYHTLQLKFKLSILRFLVEILLYLPVCKKTIDSFVDKAIELRKARRHCDIELRKCRKDFEITEKSVAMYALSQPPGAAFANNSSSNISVNSSSKREEKKLTKELRDLTDDIEAMEKKLAQLDKDLVNTTCSRIVPLGFDRDGSSYWIFDYFGPNAECGDVGRLYILSASFAMSAASISSDSLSDASTPTSRRPDWSFLDTKQQLDELLACLKSKKEKPLKEALQAMYEHLVQSFKKAPSINPENMTSSDNAIANPLASPPPDELVLRRGKRILQTSDPVYSFTRYQNKWQ